MKSTLDMKAMNQLFLDARSYNEFTEQKVDAETVQELYDLLKWGPTSMNTQPARYLFLQTEEAKKRLTPLMLASNAEKVLNAPVTVIIALDTKFYRHLPTQFTAYDAKPIFESNQALSESTAMRNSSLQGAYMMLAARALGLDSGAMSGFDASKVDEEFFPNGNWKTNFIVNLGYGKPDGYHPRGPRLTFDQVAKVI